jgi:hypothetical protein
MPDNTLETPFDISRDAYGKLFYRDREGREAVGATIVRAFPLSDPERWISLCDAKGRELLCLETLDKLPENARRIIEQELADRDFAPVIEQVFRTSGTTEPCEWDVATDRGTAKLVLKSEEDVRRLGPHRAVIRDAFGVRFLIPDCRTLDANSRQIIERYL